MLDQFVNFNTPTKPHLAAQLQLQIDSLGLGVGDVLTIRKRYLDRLADENAGGEKTVVLVPHSIEQIVIPPLGEIIDLLESDPYDFRLAFRWNGCWYWVQFAPFQFSDYRKGGTKRKNPPLWKKEKEVIKMSY